jgi:hypothetical protein
VPVVPGLVPSLAGKMACARVTLQHEGVLNCAAYFLKTCHNLLWIMGVVDIRITDVECSTVLLVSASKDSGYGLEVVLFIWNVMQHQEIWVNQVSVKGF